MTSALGSVRVKSKQKYPSKMPSDQVLNVNDLLNFTLPPRQPRPIISTPRRSRKTGTSQGVWNKERFVNAQYRFVMNPTGDYTAHFADPDIFFQWHDILQVIIPRTSALSAATDGESSTQGEGFMTCPICLSPPTASRMTKCGHVFCYPCILHYLNTSENKWARCPICFDSVNERQLKSVKWFDAPQSDESSWKSNSSSDMIFEAPRVGSSLKMKLIQRPQITTLALPRSPTWPSDLLPPHQTPFHFLPDIYNFAKFMLATPDYLISNLNRDLDELATERLVLESTSDALGLMFVDAAETKVGEQLSKASALDTPILRAEIEKTRHEQEEINDRSSLYVKEKLQCAAEAGEVPLEFLALRSGSTSISTVPNHLRPQSRNQPRQRRNLNPPPPSTSSYYFYQAASGLPLYLHPLDIRILLSHFHSYSSFPDSITVRVECISVGSVNDDLRKRCKYLAHLPEGTDVVFIECDLEGVVGPEGLKNFEAPLRMRTAKRKEKERKEEKARFKAQEREKEKLNTSLSDWAGSTRAAIADGHSREKIELSPTQAPTPTFVTSATSNSGVWGTRSFASTLHSPSTFGSVSTAQQQQSSGSTAEDEWDIDVAWHELEQRNGGGRRKRANKLVILGSGGAGARRRLFIQQSIAKYNTHSL